MKVIKLQNVSYAYKEAPVLKNINLSVNKGEILVILGGSGAGKSTMLKIILGLIRPDIGAVHLFNQDITNLKEQEILELRHRIGMVFQGGALFDSMPVWQNVGYCMMEHHQSRLEDVQRRVREELSFVGLEYTFDYFPSELSGGMRKRVAIARAVLCSPEIVLFDEPTTGLDPIGSKVINDLIVRMRDEKRVTSVVVTHILKDAYAIADRLVMMKDGEILFQGSSQQLQTFEHEYVQRFIQ